MRCVLDIQGAQGNSRFRGIGRYSLNLAKALAKLAGDHEVWILLNGALRQSIDSLRSIFGELIPQQHIVAFEVPQPVSGDREANAWRRRAAERIREHFLTSLSPDIVHVSSMFDGFHDDTVTSVHAGPVPFSTAVTLYDLIPLLRPKEELWSATIKDHYFRKAQQLKRASLLTAISESSRREAIDVLHLLPELVVNISTGAEDIFREMQYSPVEVLKLRKRFGITRDFVLYSGALDPRKNIEGLIQAFAQLSEGLRITHQLVIVGAHDSSRRKSLENLVRLAGLGSDSVLFLGHVDDIDLIALYNLCIAFLFLSFHEGFGLPVLEAMACGAPVLASNTTSLPEVMGSPVGLVDLCRPAEIAQRLSDVLTQPLLRQRMRDYGLMRAREFTWDRVGKRAWSAFEELHSRRDSTRISVLSTVSKASRLPRMAYFSPLPPAQSGISDYSAELLPDLACFYDIELVVQQETVDSAWMTNFPMRDPSYFERHFRKYDRILYHIGNSPFHTYMFAILQRHPGVVVLHDFYQTAVINWMQVYGGLSDYFSQAVYESHGYLGLQQLKANGKEWAIRTLPCNRHVLDAASGIIVHSQFSRALASKWYGAGIGTDWRVVPFPRVPRHKDRTAARERLGIGSEDYVVCSFGMLDSKKLNNKLLSSWLISSLARADKSLLVFVGEDYGAKYQADMLDIIANSSVKERIRITGFVPLETYRDYLAATDCAVQLRSDSRGETSAAVLDCLAFGVPLIVNCNGSLAELPTSVATKLPDEFSEQQLRDALEFLWSNPVDRKRLGDTALHVIESKHHPAQVAKLYRDVIEGFDATHERAVEQELLASLSRFDCNISATPEDLAQTAMCLARNRRHKVAQLLVDVSSTAKHNLRTGIERTATRLMMELLRDAGGLRAEPVRFVERQWKYAHELSLRTIGSAVQLEEGAMEFRVGDVYLALDWSPESLELGRDLFFDLRSQAIPIYFVIYDLLPILQPQMFPAWAVDQFLRWITAVCEVADGVACISRSVADELATWLSTVQVSRSRPLRISWFHLGANLKNDLSPGDFSANAEGILRALTARPSFLMVGTIEPRKGHALALSACEQLWDKGINFNLVIVGKEGWNVEMLAKSLRMHRRRGRRLFWLCDASDELLIQVYARASALLAASEGEGFGLPLLEAAAAGIPIIARNIPVFHEVAGDHAYYFYGDSAAELASTLQTWLELFKEEGVPTSKGIRWLTWEESAEQLKQIVLGQRLYREWLPTTLTRHDNS